MRDGVVAPAATTPSRASHHPRPTEPLTEMGHDKVTTLDVIWTTT